MSRSLPPALRVLIADDSSVLRRHLREAIGAVAGVEVIGEAADGSEAIREARQMRPEVVVLDLQMPRMGGMEAIRELIGVPSPPYVIVLTNHADAIYREACLAAGADRFFDKSAEVERVLDVLGDLVRAARA